MVRALRVLLLVILASSLVAQTPDAPPTQSFTDAEGSAVLHTFAGALESHSLSRFLATFDADAYPRFSVFAGEMDSYFGRYDEFRVHYQLKQTETQSDGRGVMLVEMQIEGIPLDAGAPVRRNAELRFELVHTSGKWKIAAFTPREFLS